MQGGCEDKNLIIYCWLSVPVLCRDFIAILLRSQSLCCLVNACVFPVWVQKKHETDVKIVISCKGMKIMNVS